MSEDFNRAVPEHVSQTALRKLPEAVGVFGPSALAGEFPRECPEFCVWILRPWEGRRSWHCPRAVGSAPCRVSAARGPTRSRRQVQLQLGCEHKKREPAGRSLDPMRCPPPNGDRLSSIIPDSNTQKEEHFPA